MTRPEDWSDLSDVWTAPEARPPVGVPVDLERSVRRRARLATVNFHMEIWGAVIAGAMGGWVALRHDEPLLGFAGLAFSVFALAATVWARRGARPGEAETPAAALTAALRQARSGLRWARAGQAICIAALGFVAVVGVTHPTDHLPLIYAGAFGFLGIMAVIYERHARRCRHRITGHAAALKELEAD
jgi:hypothetical protein